MDFIWNFPIYSVNIACVSLLMIPQTACTWEKFKLLFKPRNLNHRCKGGMNDMLDDFVLTFVLPCPDMATYVLWTNSTTQPTQLYKLSSVGCNSKGTQ